MRRFYYSTWSYRDIIIDLDIVIIDQAALAAGYHEHLLRNVQLPLLLKIQVILFVDHTELCLYVVDGAQSS